MRWLVTAFEPFAGASSNSSLLVLRELEKKNWEGNIEFLAPVPVKFQGAWTYLKDHLNRGSYDGVLALGQAETRKLISLERVALNWIDARIADNSGSRPGEQRVSESGPDMHWTNIAWTNMESIAGVATSYSAGTFVCNHIFFEIMEWAKANGKLGGFVHIPLLESQVDSRFAGMPRMPDSQAVGAMESILKFLVKP